MRNEKGQFVKGNIPEAGFKKGHHPKTEFKKGHPPTKGCFKKGQNCGSKNNNWKGGEIKDRNDYIIILKSSHPRANNHGYVKRAILVMEKKLSRYLIEEEVVHHKGIKYPLGSIENKQDDRPENLGLFKNNSAHAKYHNHKRKRNTLGQFIS